MKTDQSTEPSRRRRPRLTARELSTWRGLLDTTAELRRILGAELQEVGLSPADYAVLLPLSEADGRELRSSELAVMMDWERSRLSHHLGRMERRGLIRRDECETDSRGAVVSLTRAGAQSFRRATPPHLKAVKAHFADALTPQQVDALAEILDALQGHLHPESVSHSVGERS
jgi:DNA-binding MarR family transcriptional regulator